MPSPHPSSSNGPWVSRHDAPGAHQHVHFTDEQAHDIANSMAEQVRARLDASGCSCGNQLVIDVNVPRCSDQAPWHTEWHIPGCRLWEYRRFDTATDAFIGCVN